MTDKGRRHHAGDQKLPWWHLVADMMCYWRVHKQLLSTDSSVYAVITERWRSGDCYVAFIPLGPHSQSFLGKS